MTIKGITRIPFLTTTGKAYQINDTIELNKKSFIELEEMGLITKIKNSNEKEDKLKTPTGKSVNNKDSLKDDNKDSNEEELEKNKDSLKDDNKDSNEEESENNKELTNEKNVKDNKNKEQK